MAAVKVILLDLQFQSNSKLISMAISGKLNHLTSVILANLIKNKIIKYWLFAVLCGWARILRLDQSHPQITRIQPLVIESMPTAPQARLIARLCIRNCESIS